MLAIVVGLLAVKSAVLYVLGRRAGLESGPARRFALAIAQGGEFAFVLFTDRRRLPACSSKPVADLLSVAVTLSMAATPLLLLIDEMPGAQARSVARAFDALPENDGHVVIAGFGRVGQIVARILLAKRIPFTALDSDPEQVDFVRKFGARVFYGDASRPEILEAAQTGKARAFVLAIDNVEASLRTAQMVQAALSARADLRALAPPPAHPPADGPGHPGHPPRDVPLLARPHARGAARPRPAPSATCASPSTPS